MLKTARLMLRNFKSDDWEALHELTNQYEASAFAAYDHQWPTAPEEIKKITYWFAGNDSYLAVCLKDTDRLIGLVTLNPDQQENCQEFNLGYIFNFNYHGKGYATEACRAVVDYAFQKLQARRVVTGTAAVNHASCRLLEKLGFRRIAESTSSFRNTQAGQPIMFLGYTYAISRAEWEVAGKCKSS
jgi:[ribosomal protein S5]-alanine N-acetyltransferase